MSAALEVEATPMPRHVRSLCDGGPFDGEVLLAPLRMVGGTAPCLVVRIDGRSAHWARGRDPRPWIGGGYLLTHADPRRSFIGAQVREVFGDPRDVQWLWVWCDRSALLTLTEDRDTVTCTERMARRHVACTFTVET